MSSPTTPQAQKTTLPLIDTEVNLAPHFAFYPLSPIIHAKKVDSPPSPVETERNSSPPPEERTPFTPIPLKRKYAVSSKLSNKCYFHHTHAHSVLDAGDEEQVFIAQNPNKGLIHPRSTDAHETKRQRQDKENKPTLMENLSSGDQSKDQVAVAAPYLHSILISAHRSPLPISWRPAPR